MRTFSVNGNPPELAIDIFATYKDLSDEDVHEIYTLEVGESFEVTDLKIKRVT